MRAATTLAVVAALICLPARAQASSDGDRMVAQSLFEEGKRLMAAGRYAEACPKFAESQRLDPGAGTLLNLAVCHERAGQTASAWLEYNDAASAARQAHETERARFAEERARDLEPHVPHLVISIPDDARDASVTLDGQVLGPGAWGTPVAVGLGTHRIAAAAAGRRWESTVDVREEGQTVSANAPPLESWTLTPTSTAPAVAPSAPPSVAAAPVLAEAPADGPAPASHASMVRSVGLVALGLGALGIGAGAFFGIEAISDKSSANCQGTLCATQADADSYRSASRAATLSTVFFAAGAALAAGGLTLWLIAPRSKPAAPRAGLGIAGGTLVARGAW